MACGSRPDLNQAPARLDAVRRDAGSPGLSLLAVLCANRPGRAQCARCRNGLVDSALAVLGCWRGVASVLAQSGRVLAARRRTHASERDPPCAVGQVVPDAAVPRWRVGGIGRTTVDSSVGREREVAGICAHQLGQHVGLGSDRYTVGFPPILREDLKGYAATGHPDDH